MGEGVHLGLVVGVFSLSLIEGIKRWGCSRPESGRERKDRESRGAVVAAADTLAHSSCRRSRHVCPRLQTNKQTNFCQKCIPYFSVCDVHILEYNFVNTLLDL